MLTTDQENLTATAPIYAAVLILSHCPLCEQKIRKKIKQLFALYALPLSIAICAI